MRLLIGAILLLGIVGITAFGYLFSDTLEHGGAAVSDEEKVVVENYLTTHIAALSPEPAVLGGTFYITSIELRKGEGTVSYEDGHVAYTADFSYRLEDGKAVVSDFVVRQEPDVQ